MLSADQIVEILDKILAGNLGEAETVKLRQALKMNENVPQQVLQDGKFITNIEQVQGGLVHVGDRTYYGSDAGAVKQVLCECGLIEDQLPGFETIKCKTPQTICPVLIHTKHQ